MDDKDNQFREDMDTLINGLLADDEFVQGIQPLVEFLEQQKTCHCCKKTDASDEMQTTHRQSAGKDGTE